MNILPCSINKLELLDTRGLQPVWEIGFSDSAAYKLPHTHVSPAGFIVTDVILIGY